MNAETNTASCFTDHRALLKRIVDALNTVILHANKEARAKLRMGRASIEKCRACVGKVTLRHEVIGLDSTINVTSMNTDRDAHEHVLWSLSDPIVNSEQIRAFKSLEAEVLVMKIAIVDDGGVEDRSVVPDNLISLIRDHACSLAIFRVHYNNISYSR